MLFSFWAIHDVKISRYSRRKRKAAGLTEFRGRISDNNG